MSTSSFEASIHFNSQVMPDFSPGLYPNFFFVSLHIYFQGLQCSWSVGVRVVFCSAQKPKVQQI